MMTVHHSYQPVSSWDSYPENSTPDHVCEHQSRHEDRRFNRTALHTKLSCPLHFISNICFALQDVKVLKSESSPKFVNKALAEVDGHEPRQT